MLYKLLFWAHKMAASMSWAIGTLTRMFLPGFLVLTVLNGGKYKNSDRGELYILIAI